MTDKSRAQFEAWLKREGKSADRWILRGGELGNYVSECGQFAWKAWQESREIALKKPAENVESEA